MKKLLVAILTLVAVSAYAQENAAAIKMGFFTPKAAETGFIIGYEQGRHIDDNLDIAVSFDWFKKDIDDTQAAASDTTALDSHLSADEFSTLSKTTVYEFPLMVSITAKFPVAPKVKAYATGGFGAEMLYASYYEPDNNDVKEESVVAFDWNWRLGGGALYQLGDKSEVFGELVFHYSIPSYDYEKKNPTTGKTVNITREYDMYGLLGRVGVRYYF